MSEPLPLKEIITATSPIIKSIVDTFLTPKLEQLKKRLSLDYKKYLIPTEEHFKEYFFRTYKKYSIINTLIFNNSQRLLKDIYIPLTITTKTDRTLHYKIENIDPWLINTFNKILITDTAGMGKSTVVKRLFLDVIDNSIGIPILIELRRLTKEKTLLDELHENLNSMDKVFDRSLMFDFLKEGDFIFFLDGYDEISLSDRETVTQDIQEFISKAVNNKFILTSRPETALASFGDFQLFSIEPLKKKEAFELLRRYDKQGNISKLLTKKLEESELSNIDEFLTNPLLVSLLFSAFEYKQVIPFKKHIFYRQVYDANFESHDLTKGDSYIHDKHSNLSIDDFHRVLRHIGFSCLKLQKIEFTKDELLNIITKAKEFCTGLVFSESEFFNDVLRTVPVFTQDGVYYKWAHKSLQEYFAAQFIYLDSKGQQNKILSVLQKEFDIHYNIFDLYYDIDYKTFRNTVIKTALNEFLIYTASLIDRTSNIPKNLVIQRSELTFGNPIILFKGDHRSDEWRDSTENLINRIEHNEGLVLDKLSRTENLYYISLLSKASSFLRLLYVKKDDITKEITIPNIDSSFAKELPDYINFDELTELTNNPKTYAVVNDIMAKTSRGYTLSYEKAITVLAEIEDDLKREMREDYLLDGL